MSLYINLRYQTTSSQLKPQPYNKYKTQHEYFNPKFKTTKSCYGTRSVVFCYFDADGLNSGLKV